MSLCAGMPDAMMASFRAGRQVEGHHCLHAAGRLPMQSDCPTVLINHDLRDVSIKIVHIT